MATKIERKVSIAEKQAAALELKIQGFNLDQIAEKLGYANRSGAAQALARGIAGIKIPAQNEYRLQMNAKYTELLESIMPHALQGDNEKYELCLKTIEKIVALNGLAIAQPQENDKKTTHAPSININIMKNEEKTITAIPVNDL